MVIPSPRDSSSHRHACASIVVGFSAPLPLYDPRKECRSFAELVHGPHAVMGMRLTLAVACVLLVFFALTAQLTAGDDGLSEGRSAHRRSSRRRFLLGSDEDDEDEDDDESEAGEVPRVYGVGTIVQRTLSLSTRFLDHVEVKDVSVAAVSVTFM